MAMFTKYKLNDRYCLEICSKGDEGCLNGLSFDDKIDWVIVDSSQDRIVYTTFAAKQFNLPQKFANPKEAIRQILTYAYTGKEKNIQKMWFRILVN